MSNFSGFLSNFVSTDSTINGINDILSNVSPSIETGVTGYYGRYFYLGDLLIQFSSGLNTTTKLSTGENTLSFPISFSNTPYCVLVSPNNATGTGSNDPAIVVTSFTSNVFTVNIAGNNTNVSFIAIGPR